MPSQIVDGGRELLPLHRASLPVQLTAPSDWLPTDQRPPARTRWIGDRVPAPRREISCTKERGTLNETLLLEPIGVDLARLVVERIRAQPSEQLVLDR